MKVCAKNKCYQYEMLGVTMLFFQGEKVSECSEEELPAQDFLFAAAEAEGDTAHLTVKADRGGRSLCAEETLDLTVGDAEKRCERRLGVMAYHLLSALTGLQPKWGILTGVRPVKLVQRRFDAGRTVEEVRREFREELLVSEQKLDLALATRKMEHAILSRSTDDSYSLYISIPFCPSRCLYCSFVSHSIEKTYKLMDSYIERLCDEIRLTAQIAQRCGITLRTVYFGGGTPTSITAEQLKSLTDCVAENFDLSQVWEYTIEAGRPDTVTREKLQVIRDAGVTRISINPQTFNDDVLRFVGRKHSAEAVVDCYHMARELGFDNINMDVIAGLPTDTLESFQRTVDRIIELDPENVTVHTLSVKRSAQLAGEDRENLSAVAADVSAMVDYAQERLMASGYAPYYLYRQRNILDNLENTGYCKPGKEGLYNVYIMDETHTILACGAGGVSKLRAPGGEEISRVFNFKYPYEYIDRFDEIVARKQQVETFYAEHPVLQDSLQKRG